MDEIMKDNEINVEVSWNNILDEIDMTCENMHDASEPYYVLDICHTIKRQAKKLSGLYEMILLENGTSKELESAKTSYRNTIKIFKSNCNTLCRYMDYASDLCVLAKCEKDVPYKWLRNSATGLYWIVHSALPYLEEI